MGLTHLKRLGFAVVVSLAVHLLVLVAVFGGQGGRPGPLSMPGIFIVDLINLGASGAQASMAPEPTPFAERAPGPELPDSEPLPALDTVSCKGVEPVPDTKKEDSRESSGRNPAGLRQAEPSGPDLSLPTVDINSRRPRSPVIHHTPAPPPPSLLSPPQCAHCPAPRYPAQAQERGLEGEVVLKVEVLADGRVGDVYVTISSGFPALDDAALAAVKGWTFYPATRDNVPEPTSQQIRIPFVLPAP